MRSIGIRELRQNASEHLRAVEAGETLEVTDRGRPIALLVPISARHPIEQLEAAGRIDPADGDVLDLGPPLEAAAGVPLPSAVLAETRTDER